MRLVTGRAVPARTGRAVPARTGRARGGAADAASGPGRERYPPRGHVALPYRRLLAVHPQSLTRRFVCFPVTAAALPRRTLCSFRSSSEFQAGLGQCSRLGLGLHLLLPCTYMYITRSLGLRDVDALVQKIKGLAAPLSLCYC